MKRRKHSVMVDVTFDKPLTSKNAAVAIRTILRCADTEQILGNYTPWSDSIPARVVVKEGRRVLAAAKRKP